MTSPSALRRSGNLRLLTYLAPGLPMDLFEQVARRLERELLRGLEPLSGHAFGRSVGLFAPGPGSARAARPARAASSSSSSVSCR